MGGHPTDGEVAVLEEVAPLFSSAVVLVDATGDVAWANSRAETVLDVEDSDPETTPALDVRSTDGERLPASERPYAAVFDTGEPVQDVECQVVVGSERHRAVVDAAPVTDGDGRTTHVALAVDVREERGNESGGAERRDPPERDTTSAEVLERISDAFFALDREWRFTYVNNRAEGLLDTTESELLGESVWDVFPEAVGSAFEERYERAMETQESITFEEYSEPLDRWFEVRAYPSETGLSVYLSDVSDRKEREQLDALDDVNSLVQEVSESVVRQSDVDAVQSVVQRQMTRSAAYDAAWVGEPGPDRERITPVSDDVEVPADTPLDVRDGPEPASPTVRAFRSGEPSVCGDLADESAGEWAAEAREAGFGGVAAVPIVFEDATYGVLTVYTSREETFDEAERDALERLGTIVAHALRAIRRESQLRLSEQRYRRFAESVPDGAVTVLDTDATYLTVPGGNLERFDLDPQDLRGQRPTEGDVLPDGVTRRPEFVGAMTLSQDVTERIERQRELEKERERLEFLVRLVRHNLLNSLYVVDARLDMVEGRVDQEVAQHVQTARERTSKMIELVGTIRKLTKSVADDDHRLEPVALDEVVFEQVEAASVTFPGAEFEVGTLPSVAVRADDLLQETLENLIHNAVQHNDEPIPRVEVEVNATSDRATVTVADNGPGMPDAVRETALDEGGVEYDHPGTGFGLRLVSEILDTYGGDLAVEENDPKGTVVHVTIDRADPA